MKFVMLKLSNVIVTIKVLSFCFSLCAQCRSFSFSLVTKLVHSRSGVELH